MGMRSHVTDDDTCIVNEAGLKVYVINCLNGLYDGKLEGIILSSLIKESFYQVARDKSLSVDDDFLLKHLDIDDWKIISYWYDDFVLLIRDLSAFFDGYLKLEFETGDEFAIINFDGGSTSVEVGEVKWRDLDFESLYGNAGSGSGISHRDNGAIPEEAIIVKRSRLLSDV